MLLKGMMVLLLVRMLLDGKSLEDFFVYVAERHDGDAAGQDDVVGGQDSFVYVVEGYDGHAAGYYHVVGGHDYRGLLFMLLRGMSLLLRGVVMLKEKTLEDICLRVAI